jgi:hypothetical protein
MNTTAAAAFTATAARIAKDLMTETGCSAERATVLATDWLLARMATETPALLAKVAA